MVSDEFQCFKNDVRRSELFFRILNIFNLIAFILYAEYINAVYYCKL